MRPLTVRGQTLTLATDRLPLLHSIVARAAHPQERQGPGFKAKDRQCPATLLQLEKEAVRLSCGGDEALFDRLLELRGLTRESYRLGLHEVEIERAADLPEWAQTFLEWATEEPTSSVDSHFGPFLAHARRHTDPAWDRPEVSQRVSRVVQDQLQQALQARLGFASHFVLTSVLSPQAADLFSEQNEARVAEELKGELPLTFDQWLKVFDTYPVLARLFALLFNQWLEGVETFLYRLLSDWDSLVAHFFPESPPQRLESLIIPGGADHHSGGQQVMVLSFDRGLVVYKPRDLRLGEGYLQLMQLLRDESVPFFHQRRMLVRQDFAWDEHLSPTPCESSSEVSQFYRRLGGLARLSELLNSRDLHRDNILAVGPHPVVIDLETVFAPYMPSETGPHELVWSSLLTSPFPGDPGFRFIDCGTLSGGLVQTPPFHGKMADMPVTPCLAFDSQGVSDPLDFLPEIEEGYQLVDRLLLRHSRQTAEKIRSLRGLPLRFIYRKTDTYVRLLRRSLQPDVMRNAACREACLEQLYRTSLRWDHAPTLTDSEVQALRNLDVPVVHARLGESALYCESGVALHSFFRDGYIEQVTESLLRPEEDDQISRFQGLQSLLAAVSRNYAPARHRPSLPTLPARHQEIDWLSQADRACRPLLESSMAKEQRALAYLPWADCWMLGKPGSDLLTGTAGWAVVCAEMARATGQEVYHQATERLLEMLIEAQKTWPEKVPKLRRSAREHFYCGAYHGLGGQAYALQRCASILRRPQLAEPALEALLSLPTDLLLKRAWPGWVMGLAGLLPAWTFARQTSAPLQESQEALYQRLDRALVADEPLDPLPDSELAGLAGLPSGHQAALYALKAARGGNPTPPTVPDPSRASALDLLETELQLYRFGSHESHLEAAHRHALQLIESNEKSGYWFPEWKVHPSHHLCALTGTGGVALAFLRLHSRGQVASLRLLEHEP